VLVTFVQLGALIQTVRAARRSADAAERAVSLDQRAWVAPVEFPDPQIVPDTQVVLKAVVTNTGRTPALSVRTMTTTDTLPPGKPFKPIFEDQPDQSKSLSVIMPNMRVVVSKTSAIEVTQAHIDILKSGGLRLFFYGKIDYDDIFGKPHTTTFCFLLKPSLKGAISCDTYNEAN
jgi:hypothetical protein